jgi:hypothetical protein
VHRERSHAEQTKCTVEGTIITCRYCAVEPRWRPGDDQKTAANWLLGLPPRNEGATMRHLQKQFSSTFARMIRCWAVPPALVVSAVLFSASVASAYYSNPQNALKLCANHGASTHPNTSGGWSCFWCGVRTCQLVICDNKGGCDRVPLPAHTPPPSNGVVAPIVNGRPVEALPPYKGGTPPYKGGRPIHGAPIAYGGPQKHRPVAAETQRSWNEVAVVVVAAGGAELAA